MPLQTWDAITVFIYVLCGLTVLKFGVNLYEDAANGFIKRTAIEFLMTNIPRWLDVISPLTNRHPCDCDDEPVEMWTVPHISIPASDN